MTDTIDPQLQGSEAPAADGPGVPAAHKGVGLRVAVGLACALLGFLLVAQLRAVEDVAERLQFEREEDLARILSDLTARSDRLQGEITDLRLTLLAFESSAEREQLALQSLQRRLDDLRVLAGTTAVEGEGVILEIVDPDGQVGPQQLVDTIQELRDAGAEALAVDDVRLVAASAFTLRNERLLLDGVPLESPYRVAAVGPADTMAKALAIPGGAEDSLQSRTAVTTSLQTLTRLTLPARGEPAPFVFGEPVPPDGG